MAAIIRALRTKTPAGKARSANSPFLHLMNCLNPAHRCRELYGQGLADRIGILIRLHVVIVDNGHFMGLDLKS